MTLLVLYVLLAICVSFLCSILEATLLTITPSSINRGKGKKASRGATGWINSKRTSTARSQPS